MAEIEGCWDCGVKFLLDECLSHRYVALFAERGYADAIHPIHIGMRRARDDEILARAVSDDRILISANARDYRKLLGQLEIFQKQGLGNFRDLTAAVAQETTAVSMYR